MDIFSELVVAMVIAIISTLVTVKVVLSEIKRDMIYVKSEIDQLKAERKDDLNEIKHLLRESTTSREDQFKSLAKKIDEIQKDITAIKVDAAKR